MANAMYLVVRKRVFHTAQSMEESSTNAALIVVHEMRRARCVVRGFNAQSEPAARGIVQQPMTL